MRLLRRHRMGDRPLSCQEVGRVLQRYLDGETGDEITRKVAEHLEDCRRCGLELKVYSEIKDALARQAPRLPDDTLDRLRQFGQQLTNEPSHGHEHGDGNSAGGAGQS